MEPVTCNSFENVHFAFSFCSCFLSLTYHTTIKFCYLKNSNKSSNNVVVVSVDKIMLFRNTEYNHRICSLYTVKLICKMSATLNAAVEWQIRVGSWTFKFLRPTSHNRIFAARDNFSFSPWVFCLMVLVHLLSGNTIMRTCWTASLLTCSLTVCMIRSYESSPHWPISCLRWPAHSLKIPWRWEHRWIFLGAFRDIWQLVRSFSRESLIRMVLFSFVCLISFNCSVNTEPYDLTTYHSIWCSLHLFLPAPRFSLSSFGRTMRPSLSYTHGLCSKLISSDLHGN